MKILGIDYGRKKIGLAFAESLLAEPLKVLRYEDIKVLSEEIAKLVNELGIEKIVVGVSEGTIAKEIRTFGKLLGNRLNIPIVYQDETLTTNDAQALAIKAGIKRKKRKEMEDAFAASLILQDYLDK
jgi:putative Holliday junction resolvase